MHSYICKKLTVVHYAFFELTTSSLCGCFNLVLEVCEDFCVFEDCGLRLWLYLNDTLALYVIIRL